MLNLTVQKALNMKAVKVILAVTTLFTSLVVVRVVMLNRKAQKMLDRFDYDRTYAMGYKLGYKEGSNDEPYDDTLKHYCDVTYNIPHDIPEEFKHGKI